MHIDTLENTDFYDTQLKVNTEIIVPQTTDIIGYSAQELNQLFFQHHLSVHLLYTLAFIIAFYIVQMFVLLNMSLAYKI